MFQPLPQAGMALTRLGCSGSHPTWRGNARHRSKPTDWRPTILMLLCLGAAHPSATQSCALNTSTSGRSSDHLLGLDNNNSCKPFLRSEFEVLGTTHIKGWRGQQGQRPTVSPTHPLQVEEKLIPGSWSKLKSSCFLLASFFSSHGHNSQ